MPRKALAQVKHQKGARSTEAREQLSDVSVRVASFRPKLFFLQDETSAAMEQNVVAWEDDKSVTACPLCR